MSTLWVSLPRLPLAIHEQEAVEQTSKQDRVGTTWAPDQREPQAPHIRRSSPRAPHPTPPPTASPQPSPRRASHPGAARNYTSNPGGQSEESTPARPSPSPLRPPRYLKRLGAVHLILHALVDHARGLLLLPGAQHPSQAALHCAHSGCHLLPLLRAGTWGDRTVSGRRAGGREGAGRRRRSAPGPRAPRHPAIPGLRKTCSS